MKKIITASILALGLAFIVVPATASDTPPTVPTCVDVKGQPTYCPDELFAEFVRLNAQVGDDIATIAAQRATIAHQRAVIKRLRYRLNH